MNHSDPIRRCPIVSILIALLSVAVLAAGLLFLREVRLRKALQRLLARLLSQRRPAHDENECRDVPGDDSAHADRRRLYRWQR